MSNWAAIIMAAGSGSRMRSRRPKLLHAVAGRPMIRCVVDAVAALKVGRIALVLAPNSDEIAANAGDRVDLAVQAKALGTADAVRSAKAAAGDAAHILVINGDMPLIRPQTLTYLQDLHTSAKADMTLLTTTQGSSKGLARIRRDREGRPVAIIEARDASSEDLAIDETNSGAYCFRASWLWNQLNEVSPSLVTGELYLTELLSIAAATGANIATANAPADEVRGVNDRIELAEAERIARERIRIQLMESGVTMIEPASTYVDADVHIGRDTVIRPNSTISGNTVIGEDCEIGPNTIIRASKIGDRCRILASVIEESVVESEVSIGPFSHLREGAHVETGAKLGNYAEVKKSRIGSGTQMHHFSYVGDATVGNRVNIGAGTITCNYDGKDKHETIIGEGAFIGSDTMLVAPVVVGEGGRTGAGSVVTRNVAPGALVLGVPARERDPASTGHKTDTTGVDDGARS
jgi:bifunctional UDP-N-acetylglucosamine pyrophosphorylase/glucosamine-1-phosphate N-acetyltransferase